MGWHHRQVYVPEVVQLVVSTVVVGVVAATDVDVVVAHIVGAAVFVSDVAVVEESVDSVPFVDVVTETVAVPVVDIAEVVAVEDTRVVDAIDEAFDVVVVSDAVVGGAEIIVVARVTELFETDAAVDDIANEDSLLVSVPLVEAVIEFAIEEVEFDAVLAVDVIVWAFAVDPPENAPSRAKETTTKPIAIRSFLTERQISSNYPILAALALLNANNYGLRSP